MFRNGTWTQESSYEAPATPSAPIPETLTCPAFLPWAFLKALLLEWSCLLGTEQHYWPTEGLEIQPDGVTLMGSPNHECWLPLLCHLTHQPVGLRGTGKLCFYLFQWQLEQGYSSSICHLVTHSKLEQ